MSQLWGSNFLEISDIYQDFRIVGVVFVRAIHWLKVRIRWSFPCLCDKKKNPANATCYQSRLLIKGKLSKCQLWLKVNCKLKDSNHTKYLGGEPQ